MQPSIFNLRVPIAGRDDVFLMNTLSDAQLLVSPDVAALLDRREFDDLNDSEREALDLLTDNGFFVPNAEADRKALDTYFHSVRHSTSELHITLLTTLQCNFACGYCYQGDREDFNQFADKMTLETSARVAQWIEGELDRLKPETLVITFFGGEPLLNLPVMYDMAERTWRATQARGVKQTMSIITNGLLLTPEIVDRLLPYGLRGAKITLDGDKHTHDRMRPLRGGQGTFDRIVENIRSVIGRTRISIGGNFDESSADSFSGAARFPQGPGLRGSARQGQLQAGGPERARQAQGHALAHAGGRERQGARRVVHDGSRRRRRIHLRQLFLPGRKDGAAPGRHAPPRVRDVRRRAHGPLSRAPQQRPHDRSGRLALRLPRVHGRKGAVHRPHQRNHRPLARAQ